MDDRARYEISPAALRHARPPGRWFGLGVVYPRFLYSDWGTATDCVEGTSSHLSANSRGRAYFSPFVRASAGTTSPPRSSGRLFRWCTRDSPSQHIEQPRSVVDMHPVARVRNREHL